jgi:hypothetical protein
MMATPADIAFLEQLIVGSTGVIVVLLGSILAYVVRRLGKLDGEMRTEFINVRKDVSNLAADCRIHSRPARAAARTGASR